MKRWLESMRRRSGHFRTNSDLELEMRIHAEMELEDRLATGASQERAKRTVNVELGKSHVAIEKIRDQDFFTFAEGCYRDIVFGFRALRKNPVFAATAILTLALGIGANTAIFSFLYGLVLRGLPTHAPSELMEIGLASRADKSPMDGTFVTNRILNALQRDLTTFSAISGWRTWDALMPDRQGSLRMYTAALVTGNAFQVLPVQPYIGRLIAPFDDPPGGPAQGWPVVLGYRFWVDHFGKDPGIVGKQIRVSGSLVTVVGVIAPEFKGIWPGTDINMYLPMQFANILLKQDVLGGPDSGFGFSAIGRLQPGVPEKRVHAELSRLDHSWIWQFVPVKYQHDPYIEGAYMRIDPARTGVPTYITHVYARPLFLMQGLVAIVLLLCCVNVGGLMMSKAYTRQREFAVKTALGAGTSRLLRQYLAESLTIAIAGSAFGALLAWRGCGVILHFFRDPMMFEPMEVTPDQSTLFFAGALALLTTLVAGLLPAWRAAHTNPGQLLKARTSLSGKRQIAGRTFVPIQVALSLVLVVFASLLSQTVLKLRSEHMGFDMDHVTIQTSPLNLLDLKGEAKLNIYREMVDRLNEMPEVRSAAVTSKTPMTGVEAMSPFQPLGHGSRQSSRFQLAFNDVGAGYFKTMKTPIIAGREFVKGDRASDVCIVNRSAASSLFPHQEALGQYVRALDESQFPHRPECRVIGIAEDAKFSDVWQGPPRTIYFPISSERMDDLGVLVFLINSDTKQSAISAFRKTLAEKAPGVPLVTFVTLREQMDAALGSEELITLLSNFFGFVALLLSALGLYGLLSASVVQRTGEIGMRVALGAGRWVVIRMILREALAMVGVGIAVGWFGLTFITRLTTAMLHGVSAFDPLTLAAVVITLVVVSFLAALFPALRAATVDPMEALRVEY
ncbi:MAG TPA: ABC transporter permease [Bryobacteraceae bacterium]|jgi:predicted permease|nr:ABC transporter permease [Bryobacteraceae bacterium]